MDEDAGPFYWRNREKTLRTCLLLCSVEEITAAMQATLTEPDCDKINNLLQAYWFAERMHDQSL